MFKLSLFDFKRLEYACFLMCIFLMIIVHTSSCSQVLTDQVVNIDQTGSVNGQCRCSSKTCGCCQHLEVDKIHLNDTVCVNVTYLSEDYGIRLTMTIGKRVILNYTVSAKNPPPICAGVPYLKKFASLCVEFYNISYSRRKLKACVRIIARLYKIRFEDLNLGCFSIPPTGPLNPRVSTIDMRTLYLMMKHSTIFRDAVTNGIANRHTPRIGHIGPKLQFEGDMKDSGASEVMDGDDNIREMKLRHN